MIIDRDCSDITCLPQRSCQKNFLPFLITGLSTPWIEKNGGFMGSLDNKITLIHCSQRSCVEQPDSLDIFCCLPVAEKTGYILILLQELINTSLIILLTGNMAVFTGRWIAMDTSLDTRKQIYGLAFCIYGLAEYYKHPVKGSHCIWPRIFLIRSRNTVLTKRMAVTSRHLHRDGNCG